MDVIVEHLNHYGFCSKLSDMIERSKTERREQILLILPFIILILLIILLINFVYIIYVYYNNVKTYSILLIQGARKRDIFIINLFANLLITLLSIIAFIIIEYKISNPFIYAGRYQIIPTV